MKRRRFLTISATTLGGTLVYHLDRTFSVVHAQPSGKIRVPLRFFDERQALLVAAAAARIFPADESGPGASEAGVVVYIDRQLASPYGADRHRFTQEPFEDGVPEQGYQGKATPREVYRDGIASLGPDFDRLTPEAQDARLHQIEDSYFLHPPPATHHRRNVLRPNARRQCGPDWVAAHRLPRSAYELGAGYRSALR